MKIAILLAGLRFDSQKKIVKGILGDALRDGANVYIFTCDIGTKTTQRYNVGEVEIFSLANMEMFDGVVLHGDTIQSREVPDSLAAKIKKASIPAVSINQKYSGMHYVGMENFSGIYDITNHMIREHGARRIYFVSGPIRSVDAKERLDAYRRALEENDIGFEEAHVYYGDWHMESGEAAMNHFLEQDGEAPDAIVAANDEMALGVFRVLQEHGYEVPGRVLLSGCDNAAIARYHYPRLTSVKRPERELGREAYRMIKSRCEENMSLASKIFMCETVYAESCGCPENASEDMKMLRKRYVEEKVHVSTFSDIVRFSAADFTGVESYEQLYEMIKIYVKWMKLKEFYLCLCEEEAEDIDVKTFQTNVNSVRKSYTDTMHIPLLYKDGEFSSHGSFPTKDLLPAEYTEGRGGNYYTIIPLHYQEYCYGYFILCNSALHIDSNIFHLFIININNALENLRQKRLLGGMIHQLNRVWAYDSLTGVFNRAGFFKFSSAVLEEAKQKGRKCFVLFLDMDGLKKINDKYGHDEGDKYIKAIAEVLEQTRRHGELLMRYGGDEFVVLAQGDENKAQEYVERVYSNICIYNEQCPNPNFCLQVSIGYAMVEVNDDADIKTIIDRADQEMYQVKKEKKERTGGIKR